MGDPEIPSELSKAGFEAGRTALREQVLRAGGLDGVFREFREDPVAALAKYDLLVCAAVDEEQRERNRQRLAEKGGFDGFYKREIQPLIEQGMPQEEVLYWAFAVNVVSAAGLLELKEE